MVQSEEFFMIRDLKSKGMNVTQIAQVLDLDRKTVTKWLKRDQLPAYRRDVPSVSKLDPHKTYILQRMNEGCLNATVLLDEIKARGYLGKLTILREFIKPYRQLSQSKASRRFETPPENRPKSTGENSNSYGKMEP